MLNLKGYFVRENNISKQDILWPKQKIFTKKGMLNFFFSFLTVRKGFSTRQIEQVLWSKTGNDVQGRTLKTLSSQISVTEVEISAGLKFPKEKSEARF